MSGILLGPDVTEGATTIQFFAIIYLLMPIFYHFQLPTCLNSSSVPHKQDHKTTLVPPPGNYQGGSSGS
jgi:hypothetical protein